MASLTDPLAQRARDEPARAAYTWLDRQGNEAEVLTFGELNRRAQGVAAGLRDSVAAGTRVLLLHPPGLDYIVAFYGCLYAACVAVPLYAPQPAPAGSAPSGAGRRFAERLAAVIADADAAVALTSADAATAVASAVAELGSGHPVVRVTSELAGMAPAGAPPAAPTDSPAVLQYSSGSTGAPKGVVLTTANMLHNAALQRDAWGLSHDSVEVSWLPLYHDLGVISVIVQPVFTGFPAVCMEPATFVADPMVWLAALSHYGATFTAGPNFAYDLCVRRTTPELRATLDLSRLTCALNGAEPVRAATLDSFSDAFAAAGFKRTAFFPSYGLAEANSVTGPELGSEPDVRQLDRARLGGGVAVGVEQGGRVLVGLGPARPGQELRIVDPVSLEHLPPGHVGEVWLRGPSVATAYWRRPDETRESLAATMADGSGPFLRTGDLGFVLDEQLFLTGRRKDLIVIRGVNHHPEDVESTVEGANRTIRVGGVVAFATDDGTAEQLVVVAECHSSASPDADLAGLLGDVVEAIVATHDVTPADVVLVPPGTVAKTTSGKLQRSALAQRYQRGELQVIAAWRTS